MEKRSRSATPGTRDGGKSRTRPRLNLPPEELPSLEEARRRMLSKPGFFSSLTPQQKAAMLAYDGPESLGPGKYED
jgi:hypothetical protein